MKNFKNISKTFLAGISAVCLFSLVLSSCVKSNDNIPATPAALLTVFQASPDLANVDFYLNSSKVNLNPINYATDLDYFRVFTGKRNAIFYNAGTQVKVASDSITTAINVPYSLFLVGKASAPQVMFLTDTLLQPASGQANLRFINLSPDAPAVDLVIQNGATFVTNRGFKGFSSFLPINSGNYTFQIRKAGTSTVLATLSTASLDNGFIYTILLRGLATPTGSTDQLTATLITNAHY